MATTTNFALETPTPGGYRNTWGGTLNTTVTKLDELVALAMPLGTIQMYPLATAPVATTNGGTWLLCAGDSLSRVTYATLFSLIGTTYGNVDGNTFNLPDLRSRVPVGYNTDTISGRSTRALALGSGTETHTLLDAEIPKHTHPITDSGHTHPTDETAHTHTGTTAKAKADTELNDHSHTTQRITDYLHDTVVSHGGSGFSDTPISFYSNYRIDAPSTSSTKTGSSLMKNDGAGNNGHQHSISGANLETTATGLTVSNNNTGITVNDQGTGDGSHNIMQPYLVINYKILAKHPTFKPENFLKNRNP